MLRLPSGATPRRAAVFALTAGVLLLAAFNLGFRLNREIVQEWDESLYATSAWEMLQSGRWAAHTFRGELDYYNTKPPLNIWLITLAFKAFGVHLLSLRLASVVAAWCTIAVLMWWTRRHVGWRAALFTGLALGTMFAYLYVHAARTANTDAINTLLVVLTAVTLSEAREAPRRLLWLGPILAGVFLLRGMAIILPLAIIAVYVPWSRRLRRDRLIPGLGAALLCLLPIGAWMAARYRVDGWKFLDRLFWYDFVARTTSNIEDHPGTVFYYVDVLLRYHYDWLAAAVIAVLLYPPGRETLCGLGRSLRSGAGPAPVLAAWAVVAFAIPTAMSTKLAWYLHAFYPVLAVAVGVVLAHATGAAGRASSVRWRAVALAAIIGLVAGVAEGRLIWYSYHHRDLGASSQGLVLAEGDRIRGRQVFRDRWDRADIFVVEALAGARHRLTPDVADFLRDSRPGDYFISAREVTHPSLSFVGASPRAHLYRRVD